jgi:hypothetical protein
VTILVEGYYFEPDDPEFSAELIGNGTGTALNLGSLRASSAFEAIVPPTLPVGSYDLLVVNPDGDLAVRSAAYRVIERPPSITPESELVIRPDRIAFAEQWVDTDSEVETVTLANVGSGQLRLDEIGLTGPDPDDFTVSHNCPASLAPAARCDLRVRFRPAAAGERSADLNIFSNAPGSPHTVLLSGIGQLAQPDLIVTALEVTGLVFYDQENRPHVPVRAVIRNDGDGVAAPFKAAALYTGGNISPDSISVAAFNAEPTDQVDPGNGFYPFTRQELLAGTEVTVVGEIIFHPAERESTVLLRIAADSCSGEENQPDFCRVAESDETNNGSEPVSVPIFRRID